MSPLRDAPTGSCATARRGPELPGPGVPSPGETRSRVERLLALVRTAATRAGAATSSSLLPRLAFGALALLLLALIGRLAGGAPPAPPPTMAEPPTDASNGAPTSDVARDAATWTASPPALPPSVRATENEPVFVNVATEEQLRRLPGVGAKRASAILALRAKVGRFRRIEELMRVKGIGRSTIKKWRPIVRLDVPDGGG